MAQSLSMLTESIRNRTLFKLFTWFTRILLALAFIPSGLKKVLGLRFTTLETDNPVGFFFEALYQTGFYWNFLGFMQLLVALLIVIPRTAFLGAIIYLPIVINIFIIVTSVGFKGTPYIVGLMLLANIYLLVWDFKKLVAILKIIFSNKQK